MADATGATATPGQGAPAGGAQPGAPGQGAQQGQPTAAGKSDGFNWGLFPDVPETQRELLEPHLKNIQGHVTRMEQQYAPYQGLIQAVEPGQVENLLAFLNGYGENPMNTLLGIAAQLMEDGTIPQSVTIDGLQQFLGGQQLGAPAPEEAQPGPEQIPSWAQELMGRMDTYDQAQQAQETAQIEAEQDAVLNQAKADIRAQLTQAGIPENIVDDNMIVSSIIANNGDPVATATMLQNMRDQFLGNFTNSRNGGSQAPRVEGQLPQPTEGKKGGRPSSKDDKGFDSAKLGAEQFLRQQAQMGA